MYYCENDTFYGFLRLACLELSTPSGQKGGSVPVLPVFSTLCKAKECLKIKRVLIKKGQGKPDSTCDHKKGFFSLRKVFDYTTFHATILIGLESIFSLTLIVRSYYNDTFHFGVNPAPLSSSKVLESA